MEDKPKKLYRVTLEAYLLAPEGQEPRTVLEAVEKVLSNPNQDCVVDWKHSGVNYIWPDQIGRVPLAMQKALGIEDRPGRLGYGWCDVTVSFGTLRPEDLIPKFLDVLAQAHQELTKLHREDWQGMEPWQQQCFLEDCFEALEAVAPEGYTFGAHPGDGADFGFWAVEGG